MSKKGELRPLEDADLGRRFIEVGEGEPNQPATLPMSEWIGELPDCKRTTINWNEVDRLRRRRIFLQRIVAEAMCWGIIIAIGLMGFGVYYFFRWLEKYAR